MHLAQPMQVRQALALRIVEYAKEYDVGSYWHNACGQQLARMPQRPCCVKVGGRWGSTGLARDAVYESICKATVYDMVTSSCHAKSTVCV